MHLDFEQIKDFITSGELEKALKILETGTENSPFNVEASFLQARELKNRNQSGLGLINEEAAQLEYNKITFSALELLEKVRHHFLTTEIVYDNLLFYETPRELFVAKEERIYLQSFEKSKTRHIAWEMGLKYPALVAPLTFQALWLVYLNGKLVSQKMHRNFTLDPSWGNSWVSDSWGYQEFDRWTPGKYSMEVYVGDTLVSQGHILIY